MDVRTSAGPATGATEARTLKLGGGAAMLGAALVLVGNLLHPRTSEPDSVRAELELASDSGIWAIDHFIIAWAFAFLFIGLLVVTSALDNGASNTMAQLARAAAVGGAVVGFTAVAVDGIALKEVADSWAASGSEASFAAGEAVSHISFALFTGLIGTFTGLTPVIIGLAQRESGRHPDWLPLLAIGGGLVGLLVASIHTLAGPSVFVTNVLFTVGSLAVTVWAFFSGWDLWKRAEARA